MGQEISSRHFSETDFATYRERLRVETDRLAAWFREGRFSTHDRVGGFELEAWLIDGNSQPASINKRFLARLGDPMVVPELARFNVELNTQPMQLTGRALSLMQRHLQDTWGNCERVAAELGAHMLMIGILPTLDEARLSAGNMSDLERYRALNEQVLRQRGGKPLALDIVGREHLKLTHRDVMLESAATSFQIHLKVAQTNAARYYNLAHILSAPMVAVSANSPYLFGRDLWDETRIPLFEQSVEVGGFEGAAHGPMRRVSFGTGYLHESLMECFQENLEHYPPLLPERFPEDDATLPHVRLHNGTIWRWNRPLLGFDDDGTPHLRIEHRVVPGGPSIPDLIANAAFFFGLVQSLGSCKTAAESRLNFADARDNFYRAAHDGFEAQVRWLDGQRGKMQLLLAEHLLPQARRGLLELAIDPEDIGYYLGIIEGRVHKACNGAVWQRAHVAAHGASMARLVEAYRERQNSGLPVHEWPI